MLILTRRTNETLCVGNDADVTFTVLGIKGNQVKIGINAPKSIPVHRQEIFEKIQQERQLSEDHKDMEGSIENVSIEDVSE